MAGDARKSGVRAGGPRPASPPHHVKFAGDSELLVSRIAVAELPGARVLGPFRVVIDRRDRMIEEYGLYWGTDRWSEHQIFLHPFPEPPLEVEGSSACSRAAATSTTTTSSSTSSPRLALFETPGVPTPERWYVPLGAAVSARDPRARGFLPEDERRRRDKSRTCAPRRLIAPGLPDAHKRIPPWTVGFIRERLRPAGASS